MKIVNVSLNLRIELNGLSETDAMKLNSIFAVDKNNVCIDNEELINTLQIGQRPIIVSSIGRKVVSETHDVIEIELVG